MGRLRGFVFGKFAFTVAFGLSTLILGLDADAGVQWCESDPVFMVNGSLIDVTTAFPADYTDTIEDAVAFEVLVPSNAVATVVSLPAAVPTTAKITKVLPATGFWHLGVPVIFRDKAALFGSKPQSRARQICPAT